MGNPASPPSPPSPPMPPAPESPPAPPDAHTLSGAGFDPLTYYDDPDAYWRWAGQYMIQPWDPIADASPSQLDAERKLLEVLDRHAHFPADFTIFEAGCGRGRLAHLFTREFITAKYYAIDVGPLQVQETLRLVPTAEVFLSSIQRFDLDPLINHRGWPESFDLVISSEVMMHIKPDEIHDTIWKLSSMVAPGGLLCLVEWVPIRNLERVPDAAHNFPHDYESIFAEQGSVIVAEKRAGLQMIYLVRPTLNDD